MLQKQLFAISAPVRAHILVVPPLDVRQGNIIFWYRQNPKNYQNHSQSTHFDTLVARSVLCHSKASSLKAMGMKMRGSLCPVRESAVSSLTHAEKMVKARRRDCVGSLEDPLTPSVMPGGTLLMEWHGLGSGSRNNTGVTTNGRREGVGMIFAWYWIWITPWGDKCPLCCRSNESPLSSIAHKPAAASEGPAAS